MTSLKIAICEDNVMIANLLEDYLEELGHQMIFRSAKFHSFLELVNVQTPDIALLDYNLGSLSDNGASIGRHLMQLKIPFIFITAYADEDTIKDIISTQPVGYIVKPFTKQQLKAHLELFRSTLGVKAIEINSGGKYLKVYFNEIRHIESSKNYVQIHTKKGETLEIRESLKNFVEKLPGQFIQIHRSYVVNNDYVVGLEGDVCRLIDGTKLRVSRSFKKQLLQATH